MNRPMTTYAETEPVEVRAGETWRWRIALAQYPAPARTLTYKAINASGAFSLIATADGSAHLIDVPIATTEDIAAGRYDWIAQVTDGTDLLGIRAGSILVLPDLASATSYDGRSQARRILEAIDAMIEDRATDGDIDVVKTAIGPRATEYRLDQLLALRRHYAIQVAAESHGGGAQFIQMKF